MIVLGIIAAIIIIALLYLLIIKIDEYAYKVYHYEFFNMEHFIAVFTANLFIYFGHSWYQKAIAQSDDILNGTILMGIGTLIVVFVIYKNVKNTSLPLGLSVSIFQIVLYAAGSFLAFFAIIIAVAFFAQTKPVYNINN